MEKPPVAAFWTSVLGVVALAQWRFNCRLIERG